MSVLSQAGTCDPSYNKGLHGNHRPSAGQGFRDSPLVFPATRSLAGGLQSLHADIRNMSTSAKIDGPVFCNACDHYSTVPYIIQNFGTLRSKTAGLLDRYECPKCRTIGCVNTYFDTVKDRTIQVLISDGAPTLNPDAFEWPVIRGDWGNPFCAEIEI